jgi:F-type H+-transporting ATPase subunit delta
MNTSGIAKVWAQALLETGRERNALPAFRSGVDLLREACSRVAGFREFLASPELSAQVKKDGLGRTLEGEIDAGILDFLCLLVDRGRGLFLEEILDLFIHLHEEMLGRAIAHIWTAVPLTGELARKVADALSAIHGKKVVLEAQVDPGLLGGLIAQVGDPRIASSLRRALREVRGRMMHAKIDSKVVYEHQDG